MSAYHLRKDRDGADPVHRVTARLGLGVLIVSAVGVTLVGHVQGQIMTDQQPMKMAAAEALWDTKSNAPFSLFAYANVNDGHNKVDISIPDGLSILATNTLNGKVQGINDVQKAEQAKYGAGSYVPVVWLAYWMFRLMIGFGVLALLLAMWMVVQWRRDKLTNSQRTLRVATWIVALPLAANSAGWLFTETARQPWIVYGLLKTKAGISTNVGTGMVATTLVLFTLLYGVLGVICFRMVRRIARAGPERPTAPPKDVEPSDEPVLSLV